MGIEMYENIADLNGFLMADFNNSDAFMADLDAHCSLQTSPITVGLMRGLYRSS